jgi:hypothetical protein
MHAALGRDDQPVKLDKFERMAMSIVFSEIEGSEFDFDTRSWKKPK